MKDSRSTYYEGDKTTKKLGLAKKIMDGILKELTELAYKEAKNGFTFPGIGKLQ